MSVSAASPSGGLVWADLSEELLLSLDAAKDPAEKIRMLNEVMEVRHYADNSRSGILVDFYLYNLVFCDENAFGVAKKSAFFSIMKSVFAFSFEGQSPVPMSDSLEHFKQQVGICMSRRGCPCLLLGRNLRLLLPVFLFIISVV